MVSMEVQGGIIVVVIVLVMVAAWYLLVGREKTPWACAGLPSTINSATAFVQVAQGKVPGAPTRWSAAVPEQCGDPLPLTVPPDATTSPAAELLQWCHEASGGQLPRALVTPPGTLTCAAKEPPRPLPITLTYVGPDRWEGWVDLVAQFPARVTATLEPTAGGLADLGPRGVGRGLGAAYTVGAVTLQGPLVPGTLGAAAGRQRFRVRVQKLTPGEAYRLVLAQPPQDAQGWMSTGARGEVIAPAAATPTYPAASKGLVVMPVGVQTVTSQPALLQAVVAQLARLEWWRRVPRWGPHLTPEALVQALDATLNAGRVGVLFLPRLDSAGPPPPPGGPMAAPVAAGPAMSTFAAAGAADDGGAAAVVDISAQRLTSFHAVALVQVQWRPESSLGLPPWDPTGLAVGDPVPQLRVFVSCDTTDPVDVGEVVYMGFVGGQTHSFLAVVPLTQEMGVPVRSNLKYSAHAVAYVPVDPQAPKVPPRDVDWGALAVRTARDPVWLEVPAYPAAVCQLYRASQGAVPYGLPSASGHCRGPLVADADVLQRYGDLEAVRAQPHAYFDVDAQVTRFVQPWRPVDLVVENIAAHADPQGVTWERRLHIVYEGASVRELQNLQRAYENAVSLDPTLANTRQWDAALRELTQTFRWSRVEDLVQGRPLVDPHQLQYMPLASRDLWVNEWHQRWLPYVQRAVTYLDPDNLWLGAGRLEDRFGDGGAVWAQVKATAARLYGGPQADGLVYALDPSGLPGPLQSANTGRGTLVVKLHHLASGKVPGGSPCGTGQELHLVPSTSLRTLCAPGHLQAGCQLSGNDAPNASKISFDRGLYCNPI